MSHSGIRPRTWALLLVIVTIAALMRFANLEYAPVGGDGDAAWIALDGLDWIDRGIWPHYVRMMYAPDSWTVYLDGLITPIVGISNATPRVITALSGVALVALLFPATWWLLGETTPRPVRERAGLLASLSGAVSLHAMHVSRLGVQAPNLPAVIALTVWLTAWAWQGRSRRRWIVAGVALALTQYIYISGRVMPLVLVLWCLHSLWSDRDRFRKQVPGWVLTGVAAFILVLPNLVMFIQTPEAFTGRADAATATTGGFIWNYDLSAFGGVAGLVVQKLRLILQSVGLYWDGPYTGMGQPMLAPLFFAGFVVALIAAFRRLRQTAFAWPLLAILLLILPDVFTGAVVEAHALRQIGALPFVFILSGIGLAQAWEWLGARAARQNAKYALSAALVILAILPSLWGMTQYLGAYTDERYADPESAWHLEQTDLDLSRAILEQPDRAYLLPYDEYTRSNVAWMLSAQFRERRSAIASDGTLRIANSPDEITVVTAGDPYRPRHDARPSQWDSRLWVLLSDGQASFLPPLTPEQHQTLLTSLDTAEAQPIIDRSGTEIARLYRLPAPEGLFAPRPVIDYPMDAVFRLPGEGRPDELRLMGYTLPDTDLTPGTVVYITLFWQTLQPPSEDYEIFVQLWNDAGEVVAGTHDFPYGGMYRTRIWRSDEITATHHWIQVPSDLPTARYTLAAGLFRLLHNEPLAVSGSSADANGTAALARDLRRPAEIPTELGTPPTVPLRFGDLLNVAGLDVEIAGAAQAPFGTWTVSPGAMLAIDVTWEVLARPPLDYSLFLHLTSSGDAPPTAQADLPLGATTYPSGAWRPGDLVRDQVTLTLPDTLEAGQYNLWLGLYYYADFSRLTPLLDGEAQPDGRVRLGAIMVEAADP